MLIEYSVQRTFNNAIEILDIGNTVLKGSTENGLEYYLITKTIMGKCYILKYGPINPDIPVLFDDFQVNVKKIDYKEKAIKIEIDRFINDFKKDINSVEEVTEFEAWEVFPDIKDLFENL